MLYLNKFEDYITWGPLHSLITHVSVSKVRVAGSTWSYFKGELLDTRDYLLRVTEVALSAYNFAFSLASRTHLSIKIVVSPSKLYSASDPALSSTFLTSDDIVGVLGSCTFTMWACNLLFDQNI